MIKCAVILSNFFKLCLGIAPALVSCFFLSVLNMSCMSMYSFDKLWLLWQCMLLPNKVVEFFYWCLIDIYKTSSGSQTCSALFCNWARDISAHWFRSVTEASFRHCSAVAKASSVITQWVVDQRCSHMVILMWRSLESGMSIKYWKVWQWWWWIYGR